MPGFGDYTIDPNFEVPVVKTPPAEPATPPSQPKRDLADLVERIAVTQVQPGDVLVFEVAADLSCQELDEMAGCVRRALGDNTLSLIVNGKLSGVLGVGDVDLQAATEAARRAARAWHGYKYDEILPHMVAAAVRAVIEGRRS